jgi:Mg-chelatase subunit ChlD
VNVAAAPEITSAVQATADRWSASRTGGTCVTVTVTAVDPADVAAGVAGAHGATLNGLGQANGKARVPDVWIPDSSTWLQRVRTAAADQVPPDAVSIAQSPIVMAMPQPIAKLVGWPNAKLTWAGLLQKMSTGSGLKTGIVEPGRDATGLNTLLTLRAVSAAAGTAGQAASVAALRALATGRSTLRADLLGRFPRATDSASLGSGLAAAALPEQAVIAYNAAQPPVPLAAVFIDPAPTALDYPYAIMPGLRPEVAGAASQLESALSGKSYRDQLAQHGLRAADGSTGTGFSAGPGSPGIVTKTASATDTAAIDQTISTWRAVTEPGRLLAVIDVSGSMLTPVASAGGATREQVTVQAALAGQNLFDDSWTTGLWTFSTNMDGTKPYRQLMPLAPLASQRQQMNVALAGIQPKKDGNTGLYDTVLAAYKTMQDGWDSGKVNSVVLMTDGQNDNPGGLTLDQLTSQLQKIADPQRPVQVIALGIGTDVSKPELTKITQITGGGVFIALDPAQIGQIFLQAIALRPGSGG